MSSVKYRLAVFRRSSVSSRKAQFGNDDEGLAAANENSLHAVHRKNHR